MFVFLFGGHFDLTGVDFNIKSTNNHKFISHVHHKNSF